MKRIYPFENRIMHPIITIVILYKVSYYNKPYSNTSHNVYIYQPFHSLTNLFITRNII